MPNSVDKIRLIDSVEKFGKYSWIEPGLALGGLGFQFMGY